MRKRNQSPCTENTCFITPTYNNIVRELDQHNISMALQVDTMLYQFTILERVLFLPLSEKTGLSADKIRYVILFFVSILLGFVMKYGLHPSRVSVTVRHCYSFVLGLVFGLICFGPVEMTYLFAVVGTCYALLFTVSPRAVQTYTMVWMLICMSATHIYRMITDYGEAHLDFSGPLMVMVQRTTYVAFAVHDGLAKDSAQLNEDQRKQQLNQRPSLLGYFSYNFCFLCFLAGPACTYKEYQDFIAGSNFKLENHKDKKNEPSNRIVVLQKTMGAIFCMIAYVTIDSWFPFNQVFAPNMNLLHRIALLQLVCYGVRNSYYFGWLIIDSACNAAGLGFAGYKDGYTQWNLVSGVDVFGFEFGTNVRSMINSWNILTTNWLRRVCYERVKFLNPVLASFILSAWWHGFYPGYYFLFVGCGIMIMAARKMRRLLHHHFQSNLAAKWSYDVVTWFISLIFINITCSSILSLHLKETIQHLSYYYFITVIIPLIIIILPVGQKPKKKESEPPDVKQKTS